MEPAFLVLTLVLVVLVAAARRRPHAARRRLLFALAAFVERHLRRSECAFVLTHGLRVHLISLSGLVLERRMLRYHVCHHVLKSAMTARANAVPYAILDLRNL